MNGPHPHNMTAFFPEPIRSFVASSALALSCDESYIGVLILPVIASAIGNTRRVRLKGSWSEPAVVWAVIVGLSGTVKSPALELATRPAWRRQRKLLHEYQHARAAFETERKAWKSSPKDGRGDEPDPPDPCEHPLCGDITVEALADRLLYTPRGTLIALDELSAWLGSFNAYKAGGSDVAHWLSMHGARALKVDRKTGERTTIYVPHAAVSITGTIQPDTLRRALLPEFFENGLAARLLVAEPPSRAKRWTEQEIPEDTIRAVDDVFDRLYAMRPAAGVDGEDEPVMVDLTDDAREEFAEFVDGWNEEVQAMEGPARAVWAKLEGYAARFALIRHCLRQASGEKASEYIDGDDVRAGIALARWFGEESLRAYQMMHESDEDRQRRTLRQWIAGRGGRVTVRDLQRGPRRYREHPEQAESDLRGLVDAGYGTWDHVRPRHGVGPIVEMFCLADSPDFPIAESGDGDGTTENTEET